MASDRQAAILFYRHNYLQYCVQCVMLEGNTAVGLVLNCRVAVFIQLVRYCPRRQKLPYSEPSGRIQSPVVV